MIGGKILAKGFHLLEEDLLKAAWGILVVLALATVVLLFAACTSSTDPQGDDQPPEISLYLNFVESGGPCPSKILFFINPMGTKDDQTAREDFLVRWDFDNDGHWDTVYRELDYYESFEPHPLPVGSWSVTCRVKDQAGNISTHTETLEFPDWVLEAPDLVAGDIFFKQPPFGSNEVDTLRSGEPFAIMLYHTYWVSLGGDLLHHLYFLDGDLIDQTTGRTSYPNPRLCLSSGITYPVGISTPGTHEIKVVIDAADSLAETNLENNTSVRDIIVIE